MSENRGTPTSLHDCFLQASQMKSVLLVLADIKKTYDTPTNCAKVSSISNREKERNQKKNS